MQKQQSIQIPQMGSSRYRLMFWMFMQFFVIFLYAQFVKYPEEADIAHENFHEALQESPIDLYLPCFNDIHVMMALGFGLLMTFLCKYYLSSMGFQKKFVINQLGFTLWLTAFCIQWYIIFSGFWESVFHRHFEQIELTIEKIIFSDYAAAAILISMGGNLGKVTLNQLAAMAFIEMIFYSLNEVILVEELKITDIGGSILIHTFGAYFGLTFTRDAPEHMKSNKFSDLFSLLGTVYLWMFWPSFNGALVLSAESRHRVLCNTFLSLSGSCITTFIISKLLRKKFGLADIQNATLAGGVAIGSAADIFQSPFNPGIVGCLAGIISTVGFAVIQPKLEELVHYFYIYIVQIGLYDTCGIHNLHAMPGVLGSLTGIFAVYMEYDTLLKGSYGQRDKVDQAFAQFYGFLIALGFGVVGGLITGVIVRIGSMNFTDDQGYFQDSVEWNFTYGIEGEEQTSQHHQKVSQKKEDDEDNQLFSPNTKKQEIELQQYPKQLDHPKQPSIEEEPVPAQEGQKKQIQ